MVSSCKVEFFAKLSLIWVGGTVLSAGALSMPGRINARTLSSPEPSNKATQIMQGIGPVQVDLNKYNLESLEQIMMEWTANLRQKTGEKEIRLQLGVRNQTELFADNVEVMFPRPKCGQGLGLKLLEIAGGREDGLGITLVSGLVEGGPTQGLDILPGDSISKITLLRKKKERMQGGDGTTLWQEFQNAVSIRTECLDFDATVQAIQKTLSNSIDDMDSVDNDMIAISLKRIRRKPKVRVNLRYPPSQKEKDATIELFAGENLRMGMLVRGVKLNDPLAKRFDTKIGGNCGAGGLCRTCAVSVLNGVDLLNPQRLAEQQMLRDSPRWRLACKAIVGYGMKEGELTLRVTPQQVD